MDFLREMVAGPKNRYTENGYNLDLTYITDRIIAMAFPASGIESLYRNSVETIAELMQKSHQNKYITINISGRQVNEEILKNVLTFEWEDHKTPPFDTLFVICQKVGQYLSGDPERIALFHCNHGKGRTGTIICCFFLFMGIFTEVQEVLQFYAHRRFIKEGQGVTQPCQIQYINYFFEFLKNPLIFPQVLSVKTLTLKGAFSINKPYFKLVSSTNQKVSYNSKTQATIELQKADGYTIKLTESHCFAGDVTIELKEDKSIGKNLLISFMFNTAFIDTSRPLIVPLCQMSPLGKQKQGNFQKSFEIDIELRKMWMDAKTVMEAQCNKLSVGTEYVKLLKFGRVCWPRLLKYVLANLNSDMRPTI